MLNGEGSGEKFKNMEKTEIKKETYRISVSFRYCYTKRERVTQRIW